MSTSQFGDAPIQGVAYDSQWTPTRPRNAQQLLTFGLSYPTPDPTPTPTAMVADRYTLTLLSVRSKLVNAGLFTDPSCVISLDKQPFTVPSPPCAWINPGSAQIDTGLHAGGGRHTINVNPTFTINVIVRRMQDIETHDMEWLTNASRGTYPIVWQIIHFLSEQFPLDSEGKSLTTCGLKPIRILDAYRYRDDQMLSVVPIVFQTNVNIDINLHTLSVSPNTVPTETTTTVTMLGGGTQWLNYPPTFTVTGLSDVFAINTTIIDNETATVNMITGTSRGFVVWQDDLTMATVKQRVK